MAARIVRLVLFGAMAGAPVSAGPGWVPQYTSDSQIRFPQDYREWVFLSSGSGMTYGPLAQTQGKPQTPPLFDNVFVNPESYRSFLQTGHWPDKTMFILEVRSPEGHASINNGGYFQRDIVGIEAEVKDGSAAAGEWSFYAFPLNAGKPATTGKPIPRTASCYSCHGVKTAVENTFVQFYPVLYEVAERKGTLKPDFQRLPITTGNLLELMRTAGWPAAERALRETLQASPDAEVLSERSLTRVGNGVMQSKPSEAVSLLEWAAARFPESYRVQSGLADAYLAAGRKEAARAATQKELDLAERDRFLSPSDRAQVSRVAEERLTKLDASGRGTPK